MKISIIGAGYVGLVTGVCLSELGHRVVCVEKDGHKAGKIERGKPPFYEPGLGALLRKNLRDDRFLITRNLSEAVRSTDTTIIAVGTPSKYGKIDLAHIKIAIREVGAALRGKKSYHVVAVKSTVVPSTTDTVLKPILEKTSGKKLGQFGLCMNPEFLREGNAIRDFLSSDRIIIGSDDNRSFTVFKKVYSKYACPILRVSVRTAEMIKYTSNALLANLISYSNEIAAICEQVGDIDVVEVMRGVHLDERLTPFLDTRSGGRLEAGIVAYLKAGCGFGGSCFPKDLQAIHSFSRAAGHKTRMIASAIAVNKNQPIRLAKRLEKELGGCKNKKIGVWGIAFKPETDDIRETPAKPIADYLLKRGAKVHMYDPVAMDAARNLFRGKRIYYAKNKMDAVRNADALMIITPWRHFLDVNFRKLADSMKPNAVIVDGRRVYDKRVVQKAGLRYLGVGYRKRGNG